MRVASEEASTATFPVARPGASPRAALHGLMVRPIPHQVAKEVLVRHHYLHSMPGGTKLTFGVFLGHRLVGAMALGVGPANAYRLVTGVDINDCLTLTRFWLADEMPPNSESRVLGIAIRALKRHTDIKFIVSYADPAMGHIGTIYQATGWLYTGLSDPMPLYDLGDGSPPCHSRTLSHRFGTHSLRHFERHGVTIKRVWQQAKYRYVYILDPNVRTRLTASVLPYPKKEVK